MKLKTCHTAILAAVVFTLLIPFNAFSQESRAGLDAENAVNPTKQEQDSPLGSETLENRSSLKNTNSSTGSETVIVRDADIKKPAPKAIDKAQKEAEKAQKQEEDPLSFNFLYYIIEKFKFTDIVE
jgi:hypothetical protein